MVVPRRTPRRCRRPPLRGCGIARPATGPLPAGGSVMFGRHPNAPRAALRWLLPLIPLVSLLGTVPARAGWDDDYRRRSLEGALDRAEDDVRQARSAADSAQAALDATR